MKEDAQLFRFILKGIEICNCNSYVLFWRCLSSFRSSQSFLKILVSHSIGLFWGWGWGPSWPALDIINFMAFSRFFELWWLRFVFEEEVSLASSCEDHNFFRNLSAPSKQVSLLLRFASRFSYSTVNGTLVHEIHGTVGTGRLRHWSGRSLVSFQFDISTDWHMTNEDRMKKEPGCWFYQRSER